MRILIVDPEYLVAMEAERILTEAFGCETFIAMPRDFSAQLHDGNYDIVLVDAGVAEGNEIEGLLRASDAGLVFTTLGSEDIDGKDQWPGAPIVAKPFEDGQLVQAIKNAAQI